MIHAVGVVVIAGALMSERSDVDPRIRERNSEAHRGRS